MRQRFDGQLAALNRELISMGALCEEAIAVTARSVLDADRALAGRISALEEEIDQKEREIERVCLRLLLQQQAHAQVFNLPLFLVDLQLDGFYFFGQLHVVFQQSLGGGGNGVLAQGAGGNQRNVKLFQLLVKFGSHLVFVLFCIIQTGR